MERPSGEGTKEAFMNAKYTSQSGFTLLELMVALALAAVISLLVSIVGTQAQSNSQTA